jgi:CRP-like cAMP-binding protein
MKGENHFIKSLAPADFEILRGQLEEVSLKRNELITEAGADLAAAYLPLNCILSVILVMRNGDQVESRTLGREGGHGLLHAIGARHSHERMICQVPGHALRISLSALRAAADRRPSLARAIAVHCQASMIQMAQTTACNILHPASVRLARWLLMTQERLNDDVLPLTQEHLAVMLGVQRTTVTAIAQDYQARGLISYSRGKVRICDRRGLLRQSCECFEAVHDAVTATFDQTPDPVGA